MDPAIDLLKIGHSLFGTVIRLLLLADFHAAEVLVWHATEYTCRRAAESISMYM